MITKMYKVEGMMCDGCVATVKEAIKGMPEVIDTQVQLGTPQAIISMKEAISETDINAVLEQAGGYGLTEITEDTPRKEAQPKKKNTFSKLFSHKKPCCK